MRTVRFHGFGEPPEVLRLEEVAIPEPGAGRIRIRVHACGLNPADWALCRGLFPGNLPRGIGLETSGMIDAIGEGVTDVAVDDPVLGMADFAGYANAGASDCAIMNVWTQVPSGLDLVEAAALPMAVETACRSIDILGVSAGHKFMVHGCGNYGRVCRSADGADARSACDRHRRRYLRGPADGAGRGGHTLW
jgi:NADPH:quinone reductase-like Zn-dependent oxidoreductase